MFSQIAPSFHQVSDQLLKKSSYQFDFEKCRASPQLVENIKPSIIFSAFITIGSYIYTYVRKVYTILLSKDLENQKVGHHRPPTIKINPPPHML